VSGDVASVREVWRYRGLIGNLTQRELKLRYKQSVLGWAWSLISPAATLGIYTLIFGTVLKIVPPLAGNGSTKSFALYLFAALVIWNFFQAVVTGSMGWLIGSGGLLKQIYFPPQTPLIAGTLSALTQILTEAGILIVVMLVAGNVGWSFLLFPVLLVLLVSYALGIGLVISVVNVHYRDVQHLVSVVMQMLFYASPIVYPFSYVPEHLWGLPARDIIRLNPVTQYVFASRDIFYGLNVPSAWTWCYLLGTALLSLGLGWLIFTRLSRDISEAL
jgi:ABC-type polysaccharide/polyol phosphate export permease